MSSPGGGQGKEERRRGEENSSPDMDQVYTRGMTTVPKLIPFLE